MKHAKLLIAWRWICPDCGTVNYHNGQFDPAIKAELMAEAAEELDITVEEAEESGDFLEVPEFVFCHRCEERFTAGE